MYFDLKNNVWDYSSPDIIVVIKPGINQHYCLVPVTALCTTFSYLIHLISQLIHLEMKLNFLRCNFRRQKICGDAVYKDKLKGKKYKSASFVGRKKSFRSKWGRISSEND